MCVSFIRNRVRIMMVFVRCCYLFVICLCVMLFCGWKNWRFGFLLVAVRRATLSSSSVTWESVILRCICVIYLMFYLKWCVNVWWSLVLCFKWFLWRVILIASRWRRSCLSKRIWWRVRIVWRWFLIGRRCWRLWVIWLFLVVI